MDRCPFSLLVLLALAADASAGDPRDSSYQNLVLRAETSAFSGLGPRGEPITLYGLHEAFVPVRVPDAQQPEADALPLPAGDGRGRPTGRRGLVDQLDGR